MNLRQVEWVGSSLKDLKRFPEAVRHEVGFVIYQAQLGNKAICAVPMVGFGGAKVLEAVIDHDTNTYRAVYTVRFPKAVYVLHAFQKKSKSGIKTPSTDINLIHARLAVAEAHYKTTYETGKKRDTK